MFQNYLTIALRKLAKQRDYALLNVLGLGLSIACSVLIFSIIQHHRSFDNYHQKSDRIARVVMDVKAETMMAFSGVPMPMGKTLREECPILEKVAMRMEEGTTFVSVANPNGGMDKYKEVDRFAWVEPEYLEILDLPLLHGEVKSLSEPNTVILSAKQAKKFFGSIDAIGKTIRVNNKTELRVVGILQDLPNNTDYKSDILGSWVTLKSDPEAARGLESWGGARGGAFCFALLKEGHTIRELEPVMAHFRTKYPHPEMADLFQYKAIPMAGLHFDMDYGFGADKKFLWALGLIGLFLLITACVNFINMATAQAITRVREVGVRKSLGSTRQQLFWQFMFETGCIVAASLIIGFVVARFALPYLNAWTKDNIQFSGPMIQSLALFGLVLGVVLSFLSGFYPGWMQARFNVVASMKGVSATSNRGAFSLRRVLVSSQFAISQMLIIGAAVVTAQMQYAQSADWGFRPGVVVTLEVPEQGSMNQLKQQLSQVSGVKSVSLCYQPPVSGSNNQTGVVYDHRPAPEPWFVNNKPADDQYLETFGLQLVAGRNLLPGDTVREFIVNETFVKKLNLASPEDILHKQIQVDDTKAPVVGVVRDFHLSSMSDPISALVFSTHAPSYVTCAVQLIPGHPESVLKQVKQIWEAQYPNHFYEQKFMDDRMAEHLESDMLVLRLVRTFAGIAIFIGCLGLYGLATFMVTRKRKEVGIRKSLGASINGILWLFGKEYLRLVVLAFVVAAPIAWWVMNAWLQDYTYRISIGLGIFVVSLLLTLLIAVITVGAQSIRAALANPVKALRSE
jgi:putative ABC transport system permease protein